MGVMQKNLERLRNFRNYCCEFGVLGTLTLLRQRSTDVDVFKLPIKGFSTPVYCRSKGSDFAVLRQVIGWQEAAIRFDHPPKLVIDAGANVGYSSLVFSMHYPTATVVGVEPDKSNCEMFRKNCAGYSKIRLLEGAVWPRKAMLVISNPTADAFEFQVDEADSTQGEDRVPGFTIPEIIDLHGGGRVNLLKLDIEGAEHALFTQGAEEWLHRVDVIIVELHDRYVPGCRAAFDRLLENVKHTREKRGEYHCARLVHQL
jgi:FkbM family methyltransferase